MIAWSFRDQVAVVTGATGGLGQALCRALLDSGAKVYGCALSDDALAPLAGELSRRYGADRLELAAVDVRDIGRLREWIAGIARREQRIDMLVNAAGLCATVPAGQVDEALWDAIVDINLKGTFFACQAVGDVMRARSYGRIVNLSSVGAFTGGTLVSPPYGASKAGVIALTKSFASLYSPFGVCVNAVSPGPFRTEMIRDFPPEGLSGMLARTPSGRLGEPADVVQSILFLCDESSGHISGATLDVNGGFYLR